VTILARMTAQARRLSDSPPARIEDDAEPDPDDFVLRSDRLYDDRRLARLYRSGRTPDAAVVWRLDSAASWEAAGEELARRASYQPLGRYWAWAPARRLARALAPTPVRPNLVTIAAAAAFLGAVGLVGFGGDNLVERLAVAALLAAALVLDTADGHLARLQGTCSEFGRWLDAVLDESCDMALHAAIAWACFNRDSRPGWLMLAVVYAAGKHVFQVARTTTGPRDAVGLARGGKEAERLRSLARLAGHADVRWHLWIALALAGRLEWALAAFAPYYAARVIAMGVSRSRRHA
jgi:phosphatidylglycerophosphate synthase